MLHTWPLSDNNYLHALVSSYHMMLCRLTSQHWIGFHLFLQNISSVPLYEAIFWWLLELNMSLLPGKNSAPSVAEVQHPWTSLTLLCRCLSLFNPWKEGNTNLLSSCLKFLRASLTTTYQENHPTDLVWFSVMFLLSVNQPVFEHGTARSQFTSSLRPALHSNSAKRLIKLEPRQILPQSNYPRLSVSPTCFIQPSVLTFLLHRATPLNSSQPLSPQSRPLLLIIYISPFFTCLSFSYFNLCCSDTTGVKTSEIKKKKKPTQQILTQKGR